MTSRFISCRAHPKSLRIFLGYGRKWAEASAIQLRDFLKDQGWEVFKAPEDVPIGHWAENTILALKLADIFVVIFTLGSWKSQELWKEIIIAEQYGIKIYPIVAQSVNRHDSTFPPF